MCLAEGRTVREILLSVFLVELEDALSRFEGLRVILVDWHACLSQLSLSRLDILGGGSSSESTSA
jgi:hypothetical protein